MGYSEPLIGSTVAAHTVPTISIHSAKFVKVEHLWLLVRLVARLITLICPQREFNGQHDRNDPQCPVNSFSHCPTLDHR